MAETAEGRGEAAATPRVCVFTTLFGSYERLNEQPCALRSTIPFVCLTDDPDLRSESWRPRQVTPLFPMDPARSQRDVKLRPHRHLPDFDVSIYIDNTVLLTEPPERVLERYGTSPGLCLPRHTYRGSVLDEFLAVSRAGLDDQNRIFEQLNHYLIDFRPVLEERPYWGAIMLRDHRDAAVRDVMEIWAAHVLRYSRRDQLSANVAFHQAGFTPRVMEIDNHASWFHTWPHLGGRDFDRERRRTAMLPAPPEARVRELELALAEDARRHERALDERAQACELALAQQVASSERALADAAALEAARAATTSGRIAAAARDSADRHPRAARLAWNALQLARRASRSLPRQR